MPAKPSRVRLLTLALVFSVPTAAVASCGGGKSDAPGPGAQVDASVPDAPEPCKPTTCAQAGAECGEIVDGCGGKLDCGASCSPGDRCGGGGPNKCGPYECNPRSCAHVGAACGYASDGCSKVIDCGGCPSPTLCGGGGLDNQCGCKAKTCAQLGATCGSLPDGCLGVLDCGECLSGQKCGGDGPNRCGVNDCYPKSCAQLQASCGNVSDGCSVALDCGSCSGQGEVCVLEATSSHCACLVRTCAQLGAACGTVAGNCGPLECGACATPESCGGGGTPNQCGCVKATCRGLGLTCGSAPDGCGGQLVCGDCCPDGIKNGNETDVDCGGGCGSNCALGMACAVHADCANGTCVNGKCDPLHDDGCGKLVPAGCCAGYHDSGCNSCISDATPTQCCATARYYAPTATCKRPLLWNTLGSQAEIEHSVVGPHGTFKQGSFVAGQFGGAVEATYLQAGAVAFPYDVLPGKAGTIELWVKLVGMPAAMSTSWNPAVFALMDGDVGYLLAYNSNDGGGRGGLIGQVAGRRRSTSIWHYPYSYEEVLGVGQAAAWHHYALIWDSAGIAGVPGELSTVAIFVDGVRNDTLAYDGSDTQFATPTKGTFMLYPEQSSLAQGSTVYDNLKIWDFAKTDFSDRTTEGL
ncbi:MAG TPA: hypothetical protein PLI95_07410 [Polyangiaceae bacterium]|nr:hypothetical protein [Polyangiaceae bacterium]